LIQAGANVGIHEYGPAQELEILLEDSPELLDGSQKEVIIEEHLLLSLRVIRA
jgi:hypothetical protein